MKTASLILRISLVIYAVFCTAVATVAFEKTLWPTITDFHAGTTFAIVLFGLPIIMDKLGVRL